MQRVTTALPLPPLASQPSDTPSLRLVYSSRTPTRPSLPLSEQKAVLLQALHDKLDVLYQLMPSHVESVERHVQDLLDDAVHHTIETHCDEIRGMVSAIRKIGTRKKP